MKKTFLIISMLFFTSHIFSQSNIKPLTIDETLNSFYALLSGPAGDRDWDEFRSLFHPSANMGAVVLDKDDKNVFYQFSVENYILKNDPFLKTSDFYEKEIGKKTMIFGGVAQVTSAYEYRFSKHGKIESKGVNFFQLVKEKKRWWITSIIWGSESKNNKIPKSILKKQNS